MLTQAIKVLSYTHIQAIMAGVEEIQMSKKKLYLSIDGSCIYPELIRHTVDTPYHNEKFGYQIKYIEIRYL